MSGIYSYSGYETWLHRLDPRTKLVFTISYLVLAFLLPSPIIIGGLPIPTPLIMCLAIIAVIWAIARISPANYMIFLVYLLPIIAGIAFAHTFFLNPCPCFAAPDVAILGVASWVGLVRGLEIGFRIAAMGICFLLFSFTTEPFAWGLSMYRAGLPYKGAFMFAFGMRFYPLLQEEYITIREALQARGCDLLNGMNPLRLARGMSISAIPLGLGALHRSQNIALSMELRGFSFPEETGVQRVLFRDIRLRPLDWALISFWTTVLVLAIVLRIIGVFKPNTFF
jgi:energy-coupling factor transport system permease protein